MSARDGRVFAQRRAEQDPGGPSSAAPQDGVRATTRASGLEERTVVAPVTGSTIAVDGAEREAFLDPRGRGRARLVLDGSDYDALVLPGRQPRGGADGIARLEVVIDGWRYEVEVESERRASLRERATRAAEERGHGGPHELRAIIPGRVVSIDVAEGDAVETGVRLMVIEAMKMQNELRSPRAGTVARLVAAPGQTIELGDLLVVLE